MGCKHHCKENIECKPCENGALFFAGKLGA
jgi:hypothetical protein